MTSLAVIGYGYWGPNLARNLVSLPGVRLARICEPDPARRAQATRQYPWVEADADPARTLADPSLDAVVIATPLATHFALAHAAIASGKHVLVEKPMTASSADARTLVDAALRRARVLMVDHPFVHGVAVSHLHAMVARGDLGRLLHYDSVRANLGPFHTDTDVIWDLAVHDLSILDRLTGRQPLRVSAIGAGGGGGGEGAGGAGNPGNARAPQIAHLLLHYADGLLAHLHLSWLSPVKIRRTTLAGSRALVLYDELEPDEKLRIYAGERDVADAWGSEEQKRIGFRLGDMVSPRLPVDEALRRVCAEFVECVRSGRAPLTDGASGLRTVVVLEAARRSLAEGGSPVDVAADWLPESLPGLRQP